MSTPSTAMNEAQIFIFAEQVESGIQENRNSFRFRRFFDTRSSWVHGFLIVFLIGGNLCNLR
jgi:hypothetical protein